MTPAPASQPPSIPDVSEMLCFSVYSAEHAFTQLYRPLLDKLKLTYPQYLVMVTLWGRDGRTVKELGGILFLDSSTLTPLLKRLEAAGLVTRTRNPKDEREVLLHLTKEGHALRGHAAEIARCIQDAVRLDGETISAIRASIDDIRDRLQSVERS
ncbi:MarR family transcriptional regulator (plasmid) [Shinella yambaruensis]|uniref:MarR family winged helix-turn-helix transcriptional regulator n=1 Tax=Shinella yambaruensis TaxID=415996 RepID=UPI003D7AD8FA